METIKDTILTSENLDTICQISNDYLKLNRCPKNKLEAKLFMRDGLAQKQYFFQDRNNNKKLDKDVDDLVWVTRFAPTYSMQLVYKF